MTYEVHLGGYSGSISKKVPCGIGNLTIPYNNGVVEKRQGTHERSRNKRMYRVLLVEFNVVTKANGYPVVKVGAIAQPPREYIPHLLQTPAEQ